MEIARKQEQEEAARIGKYAAMIQLGYSSPLIKGERFPELESDLISILLKTRPKHIYTHNPADKHQTHVLVFWAVISALRRLNPEDRPQFLWGCEGWRGLDWMLDSDKVIHDLKSSRKLASSLLAVFNSQIGGGKQYDRATIGRRQSNATFFQSHSIDVSDQISYAMDLSPLIKDDKLDIIGYVVDYIDRFRADVIGSLEKYINGNNS